MAPKCCRPLDMVFGIGCKVLSIHRNITIYWNYGESHKRWHWTRPVKNMFRVSQFTVWSDDYRRIHCVQFPGAIIHSRLLCGLLLQLHSVHQFVLVFGSALCRIRRNVPAHGSFGSEKTARYRWNETMSDRCHQLSEQHCNVSVDLWLII